MNLKSLKKYKVPISILAIVLLSLILIVTLVTLMKPKNKESFSVECGENELNIVEGRLKADTYISRHRVNMGLCTSVTIPVSVTSIGYNAFAFKTDLTQITFETGSQLTSIGADTFANSLITSIDIPNSVTEIGEEAFARSGLKTITFQSGSKLKTIGDGAFANIPNIDSVQTSTDYALIELKQGQVMSIFPRSTDADFGGGHVVVIYNRKTDKVTSLCSNGIEELKS